MMEIGSFADALELVDQSFSEVDMRGLDLRGRVFEACTFARCVFASQDLSKSKFIDCSFNECDLSNIELRGASFRDVNFSDSKLVGINWAQATAISHLNFERCAISYCVFAGLDLRKSKIHSCVAKEADFSEANLSEVDFRGTDLIGARFANTNLSKSDLRQAINYSIHPLENKIRKAKFSLPEATLLLYGLDIILDE